MCGIAVLLDPVGSSLGNQIPEMIGSLRHRGPDDEGFAVMTQDGRLSCWTGGDTAIASRESHLPYTSDNFFKPQGGRVTLGHRRLSIVDLSATGHQPLCSPDGRYWISYNGEVYNYRELRLELEAQGYKFFSHTDTETLLAAYDRWGIDMLKHLVGMFSFAIMDSLKKRLFVARDFFGIKPLYYWQGKEGVAFASEIKSLLNLPQVHRQINSQRLYYYLLNGITDFEDETLFSDIRQVPAAHFLVIDFSKSELEVEPKRYWSLEDSLDERAQSLSFERAATELRDIFLENVSLHLRSDVPVGAALSGGIDSSSIVMAMRHLQGPKLEIHGFSFIPNEDSISEEKWIDLIGEASKATIHKVSPSAGDLRADIDRLIRCQDEPFGSTSIYAQHRVFRLAREEGIKVMLDGQGADETFAGYLPYYGPRLTSLIRRGQIIEACRFSSAIGSRPNAALKAGVMHFAKTILPKRLHRSARKVAGKPLAPDWLNENWFNARNVVFQSPSLEIRTHDALKETLRDQLTRTSLPALLRYEDRNSMAFSIESRVPFLTPRLVGFVHSLPENYLISRDGTTKAVFRKAMRGLVPDPILDRKDKIGFNTPERRWLLEISEYVDTVFNSEAAKHCSALNIEKIRARWQKIKSDKSNFDFQVWRWVNLIRWAEVNGVSFE